MSDVLTSYYTHTSTGVKEMKDTLYPDVENVIQIITPDKTPFIASAGSKKATNVLHEWLEDELKSPTGTNKAIEGADAVATTRAQPSRLSNYCQILEDSFKVSGTLEAVNPIGRQSIVRYESDKSMKYLATELEYAAINNATAAAGDAGTARQMKGLVGFIATNDESYSTYNATNDFSETKLMAMAEDCYEAGGEPDIILVPPKQARKMAAWDQNSRITVNANASEKTLVMAVMVLETPFGRMKVTIDRYIAQDDDSGTKYDRVFVYDSDKVSIGTLRPFRVKPLAATGDSVKLLSIGEYTFILHNEKAAAKCTKCATD